MSVYFATCREANAVKIGSSVDPHSRLREIQVGCPLTVTIEAVLPGTCEEEFALHRRFADDRLRGEWFTITPMIEAIMANYPAPSPPPKREPVPHCERIKRARETWEMSQHRQNRKRYAAAMAEMRAAKEIA